MSESADNYDRHEQVIGDDIRGSGFVESVPHFWYQVIDTATELVAKGHGIVVRIRDRGDEEHELKPEEVKTVVPDDEVEGGYSIVKHNGVRVAVIGAAILGAGAGIAVYKKKHRQD